MTVQPLAARSPWCHDHRGRTYFYEEYLELIESFHGHAAPGLVMGGKMVDAALKQMKQGILFDALCETANCLPDAIQLLTPCTVGNGWLKIIHLGRFALTLYDKYEGNGIRVSVDLKQLKKWPEIENWMFSFVAKKDQDSELLSEHIRESGASLFKTETVRIRPQFMKKQHLGKKAVCPLCGESYPVRHGAVCRGCQGDAPYIGAEPSPQIPNLKAVPTEHAEGKKILHDMTQIIPGKSKGAAFKKGQIITVGDICRLQQMGRHSVYVEDEQISETDRVHENDAASAFARKMAGDGVSFMTPAAEGKINLRAARDGLLCVDENQLEMFNLIPGVMCASRHNHTLTCEGRNIAGTRAIPLYLPRTDFQNALSILGKGPMFQVLSLRKAGVGILVTGTEVFQGLIKDAFIPIIRSKIEALGCSLLHSLIVPDDREAISEGIRELLNAGADLIVTTAGLSVDPDDVTRQGLADAGAEDMLYGAPILPGAMTLLAHIGSVQLIGVPACALYFKTTSFDLLLPRLLAGVSVTRSDLAKMGHGAMCLECKICTFPKCPFGK